MEHPVEENAGDEHTGNGRSVPATELGLPEFLRNLISLVCALRSNLQETTVHVPQVAKQLDSVSDATETAVVEILNVLESLAASIHDARGALAGLSADEDFRSAYLQRLEQEIPELADSALWKEYVGCFGDSTAVKRIHAALEQTDKASTDIAVALQVQDVTSQQIAGATHLIEKVETLLQDALQYYETVAEGRGVEERVEREDRAAKPLAFDSGAVYTKSTSRQDEADRIAREFKDK